MRSRLAARLFRPLLVVGGVAMMFVAAPTVHPPMSNTATVPVPWLKTVGNTIVTASTGQEVTLRGANVLRSEWDLDMDLERRGIPIMANRWKGNVILRGFASDPVNSGNSQYLGMLDEHVSLAEANHMYVIFAWRSYSIDGEPPNMPDDQARQALVQLAQRYRGKPNVMYALQVEPHDVTWSQVQPRYVQMVDAIRTASSPYKPIIMVPGIDWSRDVSGAITNPVARENVIYKSHPYNNQSQFQHQFIDAHNAGLPVFIGEFGYWPDGDMFMSDVNALLTIVRQRNLGWTAWVFDDGAGSTALVTNRSTFDPTSPYGVAIKSEMTTTPPLPTDGSTGGAAPALHVSGNRLLTSTGATYRLLGVNRSGGEFACIQGNGMWDGPMDQASITAMRSWKVRAVRVPLNEECWLGTNNVPSTGASGSAYQQNVRNYVNLLITNGITPIIDMHWNFGQHGGAGADCSDAIARCLKPMPDAQFAPQFWTSVANTFKGNDAVVLDLSNEPFPDIAAGNTTAGWTCFRDGGTCPGIGYPVAGFQNLVNTVRATGATNVIMIGGLTWSNNLAEWLQFKPRDPLNNLMAFAHVYNFNSCANTSCWDSQLAPVAAQVPLTMSEFGEDDCAHGFVDQVMNWADARGVGYLGWTWNTWPCTSGPALITDYNGTPTAFGQGIRDHLATVSN
jgi:hypothetical protein